LEASKAIVGVLWTRETRGVGWIMAETENQGDYQCRKNLMCCLWCRSRFSVPLLPLQLLLGLLVFSGCSVPQRHQNVHGVHYVPQTRTQVGTIDHRQYGRKEVPRIVRNGAFSTHDKIVSPSSQKEREEKKNE
jgi:hypothetical protein